MFFIRYACYLCDYNLCKKCVEKREKERTEEEERCTSHLESPFGTCKDVLINESEDKQKSFCNSFTSTFLLQGTEDIPLIDDVLSGDVPPEAALTPCTRPESWSTAHTAPQVIPCRNSVVSYTPPVSTSLPTKAAPVLSPDVFHLRCPLVSPENLGTPPGSRENIHTHGIGEHLEGCW